MQKIHTAIDISTNFTECSVKKIEHYSFNTKETKIVSSKLLNEI